MYSCRFFNITVLSFPSKLPSICSAIFSIGLPSNRTFLILAAPSAGSLSVLRIYLFGCLYAYIRGIWIFTFVVSYTVISFEYSYFIPLEFEADAQIRYLPAVLIRKLPPLSVSVPSMYSSTETGSYSCASSEYRFNIHSIDFTYLFSVVEIQSRYPYALCRGLKTQPLPFYLTSLRLRRVLLSASGLAMDFA